MSMVVSLLESTTLQQQFLTRLEKYWVPVFAVRRLFTFSSF